MSEPNCYVRVDEHGVMRVGDGRLMLDSIIIPFQRGESPESIHSQYPSATLEQIYGAIAYYLGHKQQVDAYLNKQEQQWEKLRAQSESHPSPVVQRLRSVKPDAKTGQRR